MPRFFFGNFDFEHELADPIGWRTPPAVQRLLAERASVWVALADDGDLIWTPEVIPDSFWDELSAAGLPRVRGVVGNADEVTTGRLLVPWGWSRRAAQIGHNTPKPSEESVRIGNSRLWSFDQEQELHVALPGAASIERIDDFTNMVANSASQLGESVDEHFW
ncbi:MAG TPA: hypothetical protein VK137_19975, partial [Planctomycetaceae bacterium]|nr:hypothetical protein [Planctomycetaceae bacterium]